MPINFPRAVLSRGSVGIYGLWHGFNERYKPPKDVIERLGREVERFGSNDYFVVEGTPYIMGYEADTSLVNTVINVLSQMPKLKQFPRLNDRTELPEWYFDTILWNQPTDGRIASYLEGVYASFESDELKPYTSLTIAEPEDVEEYKNRFVSELDGKIEGVSHEDIALFAEKRNTARSLLMARAAFYRADAFNGAVRLFLGFMHAGEARRFLKNPESVRRYLETAHEEIRQVYERNEEMNTQITDLFRKVDAGIPSLERPLVLKQIVTQAFASYIKENSSANIIILND